MQKLNFPKYNFRFKSNENKTLIFDIIRKKFVILTPEEWVRQHTLHFLITEKKYPVSYINVEKQLLLNDTVKRYDIVIFKNDGDVEIIIECKAPSVTINQVSFDQIARYNLALNSNLLMVTNGLTHYFCKMDIKNKKYIFLRDLPKYEQLK
ncbi:MAG: type I restriction enzyme HsdR N-terminal domain-containing protein [Flavobacteriaceae bacterium]|nr:type I restriction enzyme HsdR N-terminal domain-containing protein [Flavobacteriaceae bacterium]